MKKATYLLLLYLLYSCSLDIPQQNEISGSNAINSLSIARDLMSNAYAKFPADKSELNVLSEDFTPSYLSYYLPALLKSYNWDSENIRITATGYWSSYYQSLTSINAVLEAEPQLLALNSDAKEWNKIKGNALALKGLIYFELLQLFSDRWDEVSLGILPKDRVIAENNARVDQKTSTALIENLFEQAQTLLAGEQELKIFYLNTKALRLLQAKLALYQRDYAKAIKICEAALEDNSLENQNYGDLWNNSIATVQNRELLFALDYQHPPYQFISNTKESGDFLYIPQTTQFDTSDIRFNQSSFEFEMKGNGQNRIRRQLIGKYRKTVTENPSRRLVQLRTAELYFILAESYCKTAENQKALAVLNRFLQARQSKLIPAEQNSVELEGHIRREKQKEFIGEPLNYYDLKRWNQDVRRFKVESESDWKTISASDYRWTLPLPRIEMQQNHQAIQNRNWQ